MIYLLFLAGLIGLITLTGTQAVFTPMDRTALKAAVVSCLSEGVTLSDFELDTENNLGMDVPDGDGSCPIFAASNDATGNTYGVIGEWDVSKVDDMDALFSTAEGFNSDISKWNTSQVIYMGSMFYGAILFNSDISKWNTGAVTDMNMMFSNSGFKRTLCGGQWQSLSGNSYLTSTGRLGCCPVGSFMSNPMFTPFSITDSCSPCPAASTTASANDETHCMSTCSFEGKFECTDDDWQKIKAFYSERCTI